MFAIPFIGPIITFLFSPLGKLVMIGLVIVTSIGVIDRRATYRERAKCQAAIIQSKLDAANADLKAEKDARAEDNKAKGELEDQKKTADAENEALKLEVAKRPVADQCIVTPDRAKRMR